MSWRKILRLMLVAMDTSTNTDGGLVNTSKLVKVDLLVFFYSSHLSSSTLAAHVLQTLY